MSFFFTFTVAFILTYIATPYVKKLAIAFKALDIPDKRKVHDQPIPRWGGLALLTGITGGIFFAFLYSAAFRKGITEIHASEIWGISLACLLMLVVGLIDDRVGVNSKVKLLFQIIAALWLVNQGIRISFITNPFSHQLIYLPQPLEILLSVLWIVGITNALNLLDGLDGLLAGISTISALALFGVALQKGHVLPAFILIAMAGSTLAFLRYNFNPAQIFLGDAGSLFLGILWASVSIAGALKKSTVTVVIPLLVLGIPIADTLFAVLRRFGKGQSIFQPDKDHLHHRFLKLGWSQKKTVLIFYFVGGILGAIALFLSRFFK